MRFLPWLLLLAPAAAQAETWVVFPVFSDHPPSRDPTLLRMSVDLAQAISDSVPGEVRLTERAERDLSCPGRCPNEIASMLNADHVVAMHLARDYDQLAVIVFEPRRPAKMRKIACTYSEGAVTCDIDQLKTSLKDGKKDPAIDEKAIRKAFDGLGKKLAACGEQRADVAAAVRFRARPDGRVTDVRIDPPDVQDQKPYDCLARVVESLRVPPFSGDRPVAFRFALPKGK